MRSFGFVTAERVRARGLGYVHPGGRTALQGVDLDASSGETLCVIGPNGSGKTTLLRLLATAAAVQSGTLHLFGEPAAPLPSVRRRLGWAGDAPVHLAPLTGEESATLLGRASGLGADEACRRAIDLLGKVGLAAAAHAAVGTYSLGMRRRLMLVETLVHDPALVLLDEPTLGLDPNGLDVLADLLRARVRDGACAVVATNDVAFAARVADRVVLLHRGSVVAHGAPAALLDRLGADAFVEVTLATPPRGELVLPAGVRVGARADESLSLRAPRGGGVLPALLRAIEDAGGSVVAVSVREPDLSDVFRAATGEAIE